MALVLLAGVSLTPVFVRLAFSLDGGSMEGWLRVFDTATKCGHKVSMHATISQLQVNKSTPLV
jgi:hypothetical protein